MATALCIGFATAEDAKPEAPKDQPAPAPEMSTEELAKTIGYVIGFQTGNQMVGSGLKATDINLESYLTGLKAGLNKEKPAIDEETAQKAFMLFQQKMQAQMEAQGKENAEAGKKFLAEKEKEEGVVKTDSGLLYKVIEKGGEKKYDAPKEGPDQGTRFKINYKGTLPDGTVFDETKGEPTEMPLQVIPGFAEALTSMPVGAKWIVYIPSELGYGAQGAGPQIGPNQTLIFEIELKDILPPDPKKTQPTLTPEQLQEMLNNAGK